MKCRDHGTAIPGNQNNAQIVRTEIFSL
uniref:Uncharacterized protein n=1 Tax=Anguilla anguilla TaxID=7936 RepID=A0A0E9XMF2_ANGAN